MIGFEKGSTLCICYELLIQLQWSPSIRTPLKWGHSFNQDTLGCPKGVRNRDVPLCIWAWKLFTRLPGVSHTFYVCRVTVHITCNQKFIVFCPFKPCLVEGLKCLIVLDWWQLESANINIFCEVSSLLKSHRNCLESSFYLQTFSVMMHTWTAFQSSFNIGLSFRILWTLGGFSIVVIGTTL